MHKEKEFDERVAKNKTECEARTAARKAKRLKRKARKGRLSGKGSTDDDDSDESGDDEKASSRYGILDSVSVCMYVCICALGWCYFEIVCLTLIAAFFFKLWLLCRATQVVVSSSAVDSLKRKEAAGNGNSDSGSNSDARKATSEETVDEDSRKKVKVTISAARDDTSGDADKAADS